MKPQITVLMPVYNAGAFLAEAIESILNQTYKDFEFLIINDGSTDKSLAIIKKYASKDKRIRIIDRSNKGLVATLNEGIDKASGDYIARMDADDVALPNRLEDQLAFLQSHPDFALIGSFGTMIDINGRTIDQMDPPMTPDGIDIALCLNNTFIHGSVMVKKSCLRKNPYKKEMWPVEDYYLWVELAKKYRLGNLPDRLIKYRQLDSGISQTNLEVQKRMANQVSTLHINNLGVGKIIKIWFFIPRRFYLVHRTKNIISVPTQVYYEAMGLIQMYRRAVFTKKPLVLFVVLSSALINFSHWRTYLHAWRTHEA